MRAHSVKRAGGLSRIARDGHVYAFRFYPKTYTRTGLVEPRLVGLRDASTFTGFCQHHDRSLFEPIERAPLVPTNEQAALLSYRALCRELYGLTASEMQLPLLREMDKGVPLEEQQFVQEWTGARGAGVSASVKDLEDAKVAYDEAIRRTDYGAARWVAVFFDRVPDVVCSGSAVPDVDFAGRRLQKLLDLSRNADHIGLSLLPTDSGGAAVLSWLPHNPVAQAFARSLIAMAPELIPHALVRFCFDIFENMYFAPLWWEAIPESARRTLIVRFNTSNMMQHPPSPGHLTDDGVRAVDWRVVSIQDHSGD